MQPPEDFDGGVDILFPGELEQEVVIFYGPPFSGQMRHFDAVYKDTHVAFRAEDHPDMTFHQRLNMLAHVVKQGNKVAVLGSNSKRVTRISYVKRLQKEFPNIVVRCEVVLPVDPPYQCLWRRELELSQGVSFGLIPTAAELRECLEFGEFPSCSQEAFRTVKVHKMPLVYPIARPAKQGLIIDAGVLIEFLPIKGLDPSNVVCSARTINMSRSRAVLQELSEYYVIVIVISEPELFPSSLVLYEEVPMTHIELCRKYRQEVIQELYRHNLPNDFHCCILEYGSSNAIEMPMMAFIQGRVGLDFESSVMMVPSRSHQLWKNAGKPLGLASVMSSQMLSESTWSATTLLRKHRTDAPKNHALPSFLTAPKITYTQGNGDHLQRGQQPSNPEEEEANSMPVKRVDANRLWCVVPGQPLLAEPLPKRGRMG